MVVVGLPVVTSRLGPCAYAVDIDIKPVAPPPGNLDAIEWLLGAVPLILDALNLDVAVPDHMEVQPGQPLPCYTLTLSTEITEV